jgi:hypothetical protein
MRSRASWILVALSLLAVATIGYRRGQHAAPRASGPMPAAADMPRPNDKVRHENPAPAFARPHSVALPDQLDDLDGLEFIAAMPELERRARGGDETPTRLLVDRLQGCASYRAEDEADIRQRIDENYQHQLDIQRNFPSPPDARFLITEEWRTKQLKYAFDRRDRCAVLTPKQMGSRFDWAMLGLSRHDRGAILAFSAPGSLSTDNVERVRYSDRIAALADQERVELNRLVEAGDREAMQRAARAYSNQGFGIVDADLQQAYAIAYALSLAEAGEDKMGISRLMQNLASRQLTPQQVDEARALGQALFGRCCQPGTASGAH